MVLLTGGVREDRRGGCIGFCHIRAEWLSHPCLQRMEALKMKCMQMVVIACLAIAVLLGCTPQQHNPEAEKAGLAAAQKWVQLVDQRLYQESWQSAAVLFREKVSQDQWRQSLQQIREPMGPLEHREVLSTRYATSVKKGPDGKYVIVEFTVRFANGNETVETVTPHAGSRWTMAGGRIFNGKMNPSCPPFNPPFQQ
jgi:hypothetical protein